MTIGACNSIGSALTIITSNAYQVTMWSVPFALNIVSEYVHVLTDELLIIFAMTTVIY